MLKERDLSELDFEVSPDVLFTIDFLRRQYGARRSHDSGHKKTRPTWIYDLDDYGGAQVAVPLNKTVLTLYLRDRTRDGRFLSNLLDADNIQRKYPENGKPAGCVAKAPYLAPSSTNRLLRVELDRDDIAWVMDAYLSAPVANTQPGAATAATASRPDHPQPQGKSGRRIMSAEDLQTQLDRNAETGKAGELAAELYELQRLRDCGCPDPENYVERVALSDVGRGYDIHSSWPGEERCIEVKSTTRHGTDIYLSENEREVLEALADNAWLYRVTVTPEGSSVVGKPLQNPVPWLKAAGMTTAVWRAPDPSA
jgi:hypothetical protein